MIETNTRKVNELLAKAMAICSIALIVLLFMTPLGIFNFSGFITGVIIFCGIPTTLFPIIMYKLKAPDVVLKYYMLISLSVLIGLLGSQNGIGIYITYVLVPLASCLYFSKRFTIAISSFCYIVMAIGVYYNSENKLEVIYKGWSHEITFRNYIIGFTIEYVVVMIFLITMVRRAQLFLEIQQENIRLQKIENEKQKRISDFYINALNGQRTTVFSEISKRMDQFSTEDYVRMASGHRFLSTLQDILKTNSNTYEAVYQVLENIGDFFAIDRIYIVEPSPDDASLNRLSYSWAKKEKYKLNSFMQSFSMDDFICVSSAYDKKGYIQMIPGDDHYDNADSELDCELTRFILSVAIGAELWIPTIAGGNYNGAVCFERANKEPYRSVDILILSDIVTSLSLYLNSVNSIRASMAKTAFISSMSHEIRTPMNAIIGMTEVALREDMNSEVRRCLNIIKSSSEGLLAIINDVLDFSKIESGRVEVINENYSILSLVNDVKTIAEARNIDKKLELEFIIPENLPAVLYGDMVRIKQVMVNLVNNAIKYTDEGSVTVEFACERTDSENAILKYSVKDTGQGIKKEDINKLFISFSQVNQERNHHTEGTGLGLAISKQLVDLMGGEIKVESVFGEGSTFSFEIPQKIINNSEAGKLEEYEYEKEEDEDITFPDAHVLVVDDNEVNRLVAEALLEVFEMDIDLAEGGWEAIEMCSKKKYDIIFMDRFMPEMDGIEATRHIRSDLDNINHDSTIVALTADAMTGVREEMIAAGMNEFLSKPIDMKDCLEVLKKYLS